MRRLLFVFLVLPAIHCSGQSAADDPAPSAFPAPAPDPSRPFVPPPPSADQAPPTAPAAEPAEVPDPVPQRAPAAAVAGATAAPAEPHAEVDPNGAGLAEVRQTGEAIEAALNAAAAAGGDTTCDRGYNNLVAMVRELRARVGTSGQRNPPEREPFLEACNELPPEVQECLVLSYALAHRQECEVRKNSLEPAVRARIRALMSGE